MSLLLNEQTYFTLMTLFINFLILRCSVNIPNISSVIQSKYIFIIFKYLHKYPLKTYFFVKKKTLQKTKKKTKLN